MKNFRWAAATVTALFVVLNLGAALHSQQPDWIRAAAAVLAALGMPAVVGLLMNTSWARLAGLVVGVLNVAGAVATLVADEEGGITGLTQGVVCVVLAALTPQPARANLPA